MMPAVMQCEADTAINDVMCVLSHDVSASRNTYAVVNADSTCQHFCEYHYSDMFAEAIILTP